MLTAKAHGAREKARVAVEKGDAAYKSLLGIERSLKSKLCAETLFNENLLNQVFRFD